MITKRIVPCLDIQNGKVSKGIKFKEVVQLFDPVEAADYYSKEGADELVLYDIDASYENRDTFLGTVTDVAKVIDIPFTVGGGIRKINDVYNALMSGADKVSINSAAVKDIGIIAESAKSFGVQCIVGSMDVKRVGDEYKIFINGGRINTEIDAFDWAKELESNGAGELVINSIDKDGTKDGFAISLLDKISALVDIPVIASGGAGCIDDFTELFNNTNVSAGLAASIFHFREVSINELKFELTKEGIYMRV